MNKILIVLLIALTSCVTPPKLTTTETTLMEQKILKDVNDYRASIGLNKLVYDENIATVARQHSVDMAAKKVAFGHTGFKERTDKLVPFEAASENAANVSTTRINPADHTVQLWLASKDPHGGASHYGNIIDNYNLSGVGVAKSEDGAYYFVTEIFILR